jgi:hypothetical protein
MKPNLVGAILAGLLALECSAQVIVSPPPRDFTTHRATKGAVPETSARIAAIALGAKGSCKYSTDGKRFSKIRKQSEIPEGSIVRTGRTGSADLFLKRMGATVRLKPNSEIRLERTEYATKDNQFEMKSAVEFRKGKMLAVTHANVPGSTLTIKNATGNSLKAPVAGGRYVVSPNSIQDAGPEKLPAGADDETFSPQMTAAIQEQMEFDEIQALAESWSEPKTSGAE